MSSKGFIKRMLPFLATFAVGIFIASFFVNIKAPSFRGHGKRHEMKRLRFENEQLKNENLRLKNEIESSHEHKPQMMSLYHEEWNGPEHPVPLPPPPVAPRAKR